MSKSRRTTGFMRLSSVVFPATRWGIIILSIAVCTPKESDDRWRGRLASAVEQLSRRPVAGRLSEPFAAYRPRAGLSGVTSESIALRAVATEVLATDGATSSKALARLLLGAYAQAVADLEDAILKHGEPNTYNDLAVAYLAKGEEPGEFDSNVDALAAADEALANDPGHAPALFNRALALERLGLLTDARQAWLLAAGADPGSAWSIEAARNAKTLASIALPPWNPDALAAALNRRDDDALRALLRQWPREMRSWGESVYFSSWAEAIQRGDRTAARQNLDWSASIGRVLATSFDEHLLADSVAVARAASPEVRMTLARAYLWYREGRIAHSKHAPSAAEKSFRDAQRLFSRSASPMALVSMYYTGSALKEQGHIHDALDVLDDVSARVRDQSRYRALAAQIGWERGLCLSAIGASSKAISILEDSRRGFLALGDHESRSTIEQFLGEVLESVGDVDQAWTIRRDVFREYSRRDLAHRKVVALTAAADLSIRGRRWTRARSLLTLALDGARKLPSPELLAQALARRAIVHSSLDREHEARKDLWEAKAQRALTTDAAHRERIRIDELFAAGILQSKTTPAAAMRSLGEAAELLEKEGAIQALASVHLERARAARRMGDTVAAGASIARCLSILEDRRRTLHDLDHRALLLASSREAFDEAVLEAAENGQTAATFDLAERSRARALLDRFERREALREEEAKPLTLGQVIGALARNAAIVAYTVLPERLLIHVVRPNGMTTREETISRATLVQLVDDCAVAVSRGESIPDNRACIATHQHLLAPILGDIREVEHLAFVPDFSLSALPVSTLERVRAFDGTVVSVSEAPSATLLVACARRAAALRTNGARTLVIGANVFDRKAFPEPAPLRWVEVETGVVAAIHRDAVTLSGSEATAHRILDLLPAAEVIHFAGHALARGRRPEQSLLLVAPSASSNAIDALTLSSVSLASARVVYLSACRSGRASGRTDGVDNAALAALVAGAPAIVAARWDIDDAAAPATAKAFHTLMAAGVEPVSAARRTFSEAGTLPGIFVLGASQYLIKQKETR